MESRGLFPHAKWFWIGVGALLAYIMIFNVIFTAALTYLKREYMNKLLIRHYTSEKLKEFELNMFVALGNGKRVVSEDNCINLDDNMQQSSKGSVLVHPSKGNKIHCL